MAHDSEAIALSNRRHESDKKKQKILTVAVILLVILAIVLLSLLLFFALRDKSKKEEKSNDICLTPDCVLTASSLISAMDESVDPCENFYDFACNNFIRKHPVPDDESMTSTFFLQNDLINLQKQILIESYDSYNKPPVMMKAQEVYHVCLNSSYQKKKEIDSFKNFVQKELGGWPLAEGPSWRPKLGRNEFMIKIMKYQFQPELFEIGMQPHPDDPTKHLLTIQVQSTETFLSHDDFSISSVSEEKDLKRRVFLMVLDIFGYENSSIKNDLEQMDRFEEDLDAIVKETSGPEMDILTYQQLYELTNRTIDWFQVLYSELGGNLVKRDVPIIVIRPNQFKKLPGLLKRYSERVLVNRFLTGNIFKNILPVIGPEMKKENIELMKKAGYSFPNKSGRKERCLKFVEGVFSEVLTRMFIETYLDKDTKKEANKIIEYILKAYKQQIENSAWLDEETKANALLKIKKLKRFIAAPDFTFNDKELEEYYTKVPDIQPTHFLNYIKMNYLVQWNTMEANLFPHDTKQWPVNPMDINAAYSPVNNAMYFQIGILLLPFFDVHRPSVVNFGISGSIVGHELGHAFDSSGKNYDADGKYVNWWTNITQAEFEKKSKCFVEQYSNFCPEDLQGGPEDEKICVNGGQTLGENLADNTGLKAAFEGYKIYVQETGPQKALPGLEKYTSDQLFFISYGYTWCLNIAPDKWLPVYGNDEHSSGKYRVLGTLSNSKDFREAFKCEKKGLMNRAEDTCTVW